MVCATDRATVLALPKVLLHDHLDGGLRPATVVRIAAEIGYTLPGGVTTAEEFKTWAVTSANSGSLPEYLKVYEVTTAVMQRAQDLRDVAREAVVDVAADGVVYAEFRWAPEQHLTTGMTLDETVQAVATGITQGVSEAANAGNHITVRQILDKMRHLHRGKEIAELAVKHESRGVAGYDIAGPESGFPAYWDHDSFDWLAEKNYPYTIHAGESGGFQNGDLLASMGQAARRFNTKRIGHGIGIINDVTIAEGKYTLGSLAEYVRSKAIVLEVCPTSNVQTGAAASIAEHPIHDLMKAGFTVTLNTDSRLLGDTSVTDEFMKICEAFSLTKQDLYWLTMNAINAAFIPQDMRHCITTKQIAPGYAAP